MLNNIHSALQVVKNTIIPESNYSFENTFENIRTIIERFHSSEYLQISVNFTNQRIFEQIKGLSKKEIEDFIKNLKGRFASLNASIKDKRKLFHQDKLWDTVLITAESRAEKLVSKIDEMEKGSYKNRRELSLFIGNLIQEINTLYENLQAINRAESHVQDRRNYYHVSSIEFRQLEDCNGFLVLKCGTANAFNPDGEAGFYMAENPTLYYAGGESERKSMQTACIFEVPVDEECIFNRGSRLNILNANSNNRNIIFKIKEVKLLESVDLVALDAKGLEHVNKNIQFYLITPSEIEYISRD